MRKAVEHPPSDITVFPGHTYLCMTGANVYPVQSGTALKRIPHY
jgi:hypothetical protein